MRNPEHPDRAISRRPTTARYDQTSGLTRPALRRPGALRRLSVISIVRIRGDEPANAYLTHLIEEPTDLLRLDVDAVGVLIEQCQQHLLASTPIVHQGAFGRCATKALHRGVVAARLLES